jgi:hypothetical protein
MSQETGLFLVLISEYRYYPSVFNLNISGLEYEGLSGYFLLVCAEILFFTLRKKID